MHNILVLLPIISLYIRIVMKIGLHLVTHYISQFTYKDLSKRIVIGWQQIILLY